MNDARVTFQFAPDKGARSCSGCTLCCKLLPVRELGKGAGKHCQHARSGKGCAVYHKTGMPRSCTIWSCRWLAGDDTADQRRPDRSHVVIDIMPDFIELVDNETGTRTNVEVVQLWVDPDYPTAWQSPQMRAYIERRGLEGKATIIRFSNDKAMTVFPPSMASDHQWHEFRHGEVRPQRPIEDQIRGIAKAQQVKVLSMKTYTGHHSEDGSGIVEVDGTPLPWRLDLSNHSPTGLEWGYLGSGPAQLALAILADATGNDQLALRWHQKFKLDKIAGLDRDTPWIITADEVRRWTAKQPPFEEW